RVGHLGDEHGALFKALGLFAGADDADGADGDRLTNGEAGDEDLGLLAEGVGLEGAPGLAPLDGLGPGLDDVELARAAVLGPLDVHGPLVMGLDGGAPAGEGEDLAIVEDVLIALVRG